MPTQNNKRAIKLLDESIQELKGNIDDEAIEYILDAIELIRAN